MKLPLSAVPDVSPVMPALKHGASVERTRILDRVLQAPELRLVLVRGPAGFGKTTVMQQLHERYRRDGVACAWLVFDGVDNEMSRFLKRLGRALQPILGGKDAGAAGGGAEAVPQTLELLNRVAAHRAPFVLFLDDCELLRDRGVIAYFSRLIEQLPPNARLICGTRSVPAQGFARLRAHGQLVDIDVQYLRFSADEAVDFLNVKHGLALTPQQLQAVLDLTESWIAALSLVAAALREGEDVDALIAASLGSSERLMRYLGDEVLARQPPAFREFLLKTSVVDLLTPTLCEALCGSTDGARWLQRIERAHLFVAAVDENHSGYRYHRLFREFLRRQLREQHPEWEGPAQRAAADCFLREGQLVAATDLLLQTGEWERALTLIDAQIEGLLSAGRHRLVHRWLGKLAAQGLALSMRLRLFDAWAACLTLGPRVGLALLEQLDADDIERDDFEPQILAFRAFLFGMIDCPDEAHTLALAWLPRVAPEFGFSRGMLAQTLANTSLIRGEPSEARRYADEARRSEQTPASPFNFALADAIEGALHLRQGRLRQARLSLQQAAGVSGDRPAAGSRNVYSGVLLAEVLYESGDGHGAQQLLELCVPLVQQLGLPDHLIIAHSLLARIVFDRGDAARATDLLQALEDLGRRLSLPRVIASARLERARMLLCTGELAAAQRQLRKADDPALWQRIAARTFIANDLLNPVIAGLRCQLHVDPAGVAAALPEQIDAADRAGLRRRALKLTILLAMAHQRAGQKKRAMRALEAAFDIGFDEGFVSSFIEEGPVVHGLLVEFFAARQGTSLLAAPVTRILRQQLAELCGKAAPAPAVIAGADISLTLKERQVIELLAHGHSNNGIASALHVSETTVRTHLRSINLKLGSSSRVQALSMARRYGLIA